MNDSEDGEVWAEVLRFSEKTAAIITHPSGSVYWIDADKLPAFLEKYGESKP